MCRGIDIDNLKMVINYDMTRDPETYIHRVGRSGRYGGQGIAINFYTYNDMPLIKSLERNYNINITDMPDPNEVNECLTGMPAPTLTIYMPTLPAPAQVPNGTRIRRAWGEMGCLGSYGTLRSSIPGDSGVKWSKGGISPAVEAHFRTDPTDLFVTWCY